MGLTMNGVPITRVVSAAYRIPTETPESDGTLEWDSTTLVTVHVEAGGERGFGYTYADAACVPLIADKLGPLLCQNDALDVAARWHDMVVAVRNLGRAGIAATAISAVDIALWDLKARLLGVALVTLLGRARNSISVYGSGGFTSYAPKQLQGQLEQWVLSGMQHVKMKVGRAPALDIERVRAARAAIGDAPALFLDANGAYQRKQALDFAYRFRDSGVTWFEEPVSSDDLEGLRLMRDHGPPGMAIPAGEYGYDLAYFRRMLQAQAVDILQADATRCGGVTGFLGADALCHAFGIPLSSHCAPALHLPLCCAAQSAVHLEWFHDHARIEAMLFENAAAPDNGRLTPDPSRPGLGVEFKEKDAQCYRI
jgi:L-alanine-DL-glutamate epimerase-like enolase superfamily enzyme